jgi:arginyl-tRNA synthetase
MRKAEQPIDFDLELAKSKSNENPVYYLQYAHARVCSVLRQLAEKNIAWTTGQGIDSIELLVLPEEIALMKMLMRYPETLIQAAENYEPHLLVQYLRELANDFHSYYNNHTFIVAQTSLREARLNLIVAIKQVLKNALQILGLQAPEVM